MDSPHPLLNIEQAAEWLGTSASALQTQRSRDLAPGNLGFKVGRRVMYRLSDIQSWIDSQLEHSGIAS